VFNRLASRTDPVSKTETFTYDVEGSPSQRVDRKGQVTTRTYDALNRLHQVTFADNSTVTYTYDNGNRLTTITDSVNGNITRIYDNLDRVTSETTAQGTVSYTYDAADRRATMTVAGQPDVTYGYDNANRLTSVVQGTSTVTLTYDETDRRSTLTLPNGIVVTYDYDNANLLTSLTYTLGQTTLGTLTYTYDLAGRRTEVGGTWARIGVPEAVASATYDAANRLTQWAGNQFSYDLNGNLASDGFTSYTWNARDELTGLSGGTNASFAYDGVGRRHGKTIGGTTTDFLSDGINLVQELSGSSPTANLLTGLGIDETFIRADASGTSTLLVDALGSTVELADTSGTLQTHYVYEPFGATTFTGAVSTNAIQFTGRENDGTGSYNYRARYIDPMSGRFTSEDPIGVASGDSNLYRYAFGNPISASDPLGLDVLLCSRPMNGIPGSRLLNLPHIFIYTPLMKGVGFGPKGPNFPGFPDAGQIEREDPFDPNHNLKPNNSCPVVSKSKCFEDCVNDELKKAISNPPPIFKVAPLRLGGFQCSDFADQILKTCNRKCGGQ